MCVCHIGTEGNERISDRREEKIGEGKEDLQDQVPVPGAPRGPSVRGSMDAVEEMLMTLPGSMLVASFARSGVSAAVTVWIVLIKGVQGEERRGKERRRRRCS